MKNAKRIVSILLAFMITVFFAVSIVNILNLNKKTINNKPLDVSAAYISIDNKTSLTDSEYSNNSAFHISTPQGLINLGEIIDNDVITFQDKTVVLKADLNMSGYTFEPIGSRGIPFMGEFDGQGHTISNLTIKDGYERSYLGLFYELSGPSLVENLRLKNVKLVRDYYTSGGFVAAALATYVSVGTSIGFISGKQSMSDEDTSIGYQFEETHYNPENAKITEEDKKTKKAWVTCAEAIGDLDYDLPEDKDMQAGSKHKDLLNAVNDFQFRDSHINVQNYNIP